MRPKPFKFFFALSLSLVVFFFLARFIFVAFLLATALSVVFFIGQKIKKFFRNLMWEPAYDSVSSEPIWKDDLLHYYPNRERRPEKNYRVIQIH